MILSMAFFIGWGSATLVAAAVVAHYDSKRVSIKQIKESALETCWLNIRPNDTLHDNRGEEVWWNDDDEAELLVPLSELLEELFKCE